MTSSAIMTYSFLMLTHNWSIPYGLMTRSIPHGKQSACVRSLYVHSVWHHYTKCVVI